MTDIILCVATNLFRMYVISRFMKTLLGECRVSRLTAMFVYGGFYTINIALFLLLHISWVNLLVNLIGLGVISSLYTKSVKSILFATCSVCAVNMIAEMALVAGWGNYEEGKMVNQIYFVISVFLALLIEVLVEKIMGRTDKKREQSVAMALVPAVSIIFCYLIVFSKKFTDFELLIANIGFLGINFLFFHLYERLSLALEEKYENVILKQKLQSYSSQMKVVLEGEEKVKALRHDMKHHMNEIKLLAMQNKTQEIGRYIDDMQEFVSNPEEIVHSGNWDIDSILNYMLQRAKKELRTVDVDVQLPEQLSHQFDLNVILGNLLENAIEGARQTEEKRLKFRVTFQKGVLQIEIENSFQGTLVRERGRFFTTKEDKELHGIGLNNVRRIVEKYDGLMEVRPREDTFFVKIILYHALEKLQF